MKRNHYRQIYSRFWSGRTGKKLRGDHQAQVVALYLITNSRAHMSGLYELPTWHIAGELGMGEGDVCDTLSKLDALDFCQYDESNDVVFVRKMFTFQVGEGLKRTDNRVKGCINHINELSDSPLHEQALAEVLASTSEAPYQAPSEGPTEAPSKPEEQKNRRTVNTNTSSGEPAGESAAPSAAKRREVVVDTVLTAFRDSLGRKIDITKSAHRGPVLRAIKADKATEEELLLVVKWTAKSDHSTATYNRDSRKDPITLFRASNFGRYLDAAKEWAAKTKPSPAQQTQMTEHTIDGRTCYEYANFPGWASGTHGWYRRESSGWVKATVAELNAAKEARR